MALTRPISRSLTRALTRGLTEGVSGGYTFQDADAEAYMIAVKAAGVSNESLAAAGLPLLDVIDPAVDTFYVNAKAAGYYTSLKRMYLPIWKIAAANAIDMIGLSSGTFNGGVTHAAGYVQGNGTTGYFNGGNSTTAYSWTAGGASLGFLCYVADTRGAGATYYQAGYNLGTPERTLIGRITGNLTGWHPISTLPLIGASVTEAGVIHLNCNSTSFRELRKRTTAGVAQVASNTTADATAPASADVLFGCRNGNGTPNGFTDAKFGAFFGDVGMSSVNSDLFTLELKTLWETATNLTLP